MAGLKIRTSQQFSKIIRNNEETVYDDVDTNPSSILSGIATSTGLSNFRVRICLAFLVRAGRLVVKPDTIGVDRYWTAADWATAIANNIAGARDWVRDAAPATGTIDAVGKGNIVDGETFTLDDGVNPPFVFEFDKTGDGIGTGSDVALDISTGSFNPRGMRDLIVDTINDHGTIQISAHGDPDDNSLTILTNDNDGTAGNVTIAETVANAGFVVTGMSGGIDSNNGSDEDALATALGINSAIASALADLLQSETVGVNGVD